MRILFWTTSFWPTIGGLEVLGTEQAVELQGRGHEVRVIAQHDGGDLPEEDSYSGIQIRRLPFHSVLERSDMAEVMDLRSRVRKAVEEFRPDVIHLHTLGPQAIFCLLAQTSGRPPLLVTRHSLFEAGQRIEPDTLPYRILDRADWVVGPSQAVVDECVLHVPGIASRTSVIPNGARLPEFQPDDPQVAPAIILGLGRLVPLKGFDIALEAFARIHSAHPTARLALAGDGPARSDLEAQARRLGIEEFVEFRGWVPPNEVYRHLRDCTILIAPSRVGEAFCVSALQAAQSARPVIGSRLGGLPEVVADEVTGLLVEPDSVDSLAQALLRMLADPEMISRFGRAGRKFATDLTIERYTDRYESLYAKLVEEAGNVS